MEEAALSPLAAWETFYVIIGASAGALIGLQFVVIALVAESRRRSTLREIDAFGTPTIVHFCVVVLMAGIVSAPWHDLGKVAFALGASGASGVAYVLTVVRRARRQTGYEPVLDDWIWHAVLPFISYAALLVSAVLLQRDPSASLFAVGATALLLLFIGIHNAWDTVTYIAVERGKPPTEPAEKAD